MDTTGFISALYGSPFVALATALLVLCSAYGMGSLILRRNDLIAFMLGILISGILAFAFPLPCPAWMIRLITGAAGVFAAVGCWQVYALFRRDPYWCCIGAVLFAVFLGSAWLLPYSWDEQVYQIALLQRYLSSGSSGVLPDNTYSAWPGFLQFFLLPGYHLSGILFPRIINAAFSVILICSVCSALRIYGKKQAYWLLPVFLLSPLTLVLNRSLYAENLTALFGAAAFFSLYRLRKQKVRSLLLAGLFAGGAMAVKLTSGGLLLALLFLAAENRKNRRFLMWFFGGAAAAAALFFLRIWFATGNPVYPFLPSLFGTDASVAEHHHLLGSARYGLGIITGILFNWITTALPTNLYDGVYTGFQQLVLLIIIAAGFRYGWHRKRLQYMKKLFFALVIFYLFWCLTAQQIRFLFPAFAGLLLLGAAAASVLPRKVRCLLLTLAVVSALLTPGLFSHVKHYLTAWRIYPLCAREPLRMLAAFQQDPDFIQILDAVGKMPPQSKILLLFEKRGLYISRRYELADPFFQEKRFRTIPQSAEQFMAEISDADYLLIGSGNRNVDLQESMLPVQEHISNLAAQAASQGALAIADNGGTNSCILFQIIQKNKKKIEKSPE